MKPEMTDVFFSSVVEELLPIFVALLMFSELLLPALPLVTVLLLLPLLPALLPLPMIIVPLLGMLLAAA